MKPHGAARWAIEGARAEAGGRRACRTGGTLAHYRHLS